MANSGFLSEKPVQIGEIRIAPIDFVSSLFQSQEQFWYSGKERDITLIRVEVSGKKNGKDKSVVYQMIDYKDLDTGFTSMQRTVGFTMGIGAIMLAQGKLDAKGTISPTQVPLDLILPELEKRNIHITRKEIC
jgi:saccharopine dehydrogenase-like NADP-dependent oxidoreductase